MHDYECWACQGQFEIDYYLADATVCENCGSFDTIIPRGSAIFHGPTDVHPDSNTEPVDESGNPNDDVVNAIVSIMSRNPNGMTTGAIFNNIPVTYLGVPEDGKTQELIMRRLLDAGLVGYYTVPSDYSPRPIVYWELVEEGEQRLLPFNSPLALPLTVYCPVAMGVP